MADPVILTERRGATAVVRLNRPASRNALNAELRAAIPATIGELDAEPAVAAIVLTGSDPAFCAGLDLKELSADGLARDDRAGDRLPFARTIKPVIGAVNGPAVTGGFELALCCDFLIASERATFADTHARVGVMPGWGLTVFLPQAVGVRRARQLSFTGNYLDAATALDWGLVNEVVPHERLVDRACELGADMATIPAENLAAIRSAYRSAAQPHDDLALEGERRFGREWTRESFDPAVLAERRELIQERGRSQQS